MSRSKKWRLEWAFFLGENGRRQYNKLCKGCVHPCKQSFRAVVLSCPHYLSRRSKKRRNQGSKWAKKQPVAAFPCRDSMIFHVGRQGVSTQGKCRIFTFYQAKRERHHRITLTRWWRSLFIVKIRTFGIISLLADYEVGFAGSPHRQSCEIINAIQTFLGFTEPMAIK